MNTIPSLVFVIDTEQYAGNFNRQMCAWITGQVGECEVGDNLAVAAKAEIPAEVFVWFKKTVLHLPNDDECCRPVCLWPTPDWFNDGLGNHWRENSDPEIVKAKYSQSIPKHTSLPPSAFSRPGHFLAYLSMGIFLDKEPTTETLALMKSRARTFNEAFSRHCSWAYEPITITGFRLIRQRLENTSENV